MFTRPFSISPPAGSHLMIMTIAMFLAAPPSWGQSRDDLIWIDYPEQGVVLGQGYNLVTDEPTQGVCVDFVPVQDPSQEVSYRFEEVTSHSTINSSSRIHASGSLKMALVKASAKLDFYSKENFSIDTTKFLLTADITNSALFAGASFGYKQGAGLANVASIPEALRKGATDSILRAAAPANAAENVGVKFKNAALRNNIKHCGQGYVAAVVSGAEVDAFLTFSKSDAEAVAEIKAGIKATIGGIFSVSGSFAQNQQAIERNERTEVNVYRSGGRATAFAYTVDALRTSLQQLPVDAAAHPKPIRIAILPYSKLDDSPLSGGLVAADLLDGIAAFFLVRDVVEESNSIAEWYRGYTEDQLGSAATDSAVARNVPIFLHPLDTYIELSDRALALNRELSTALRLCQVELQEANRLQDALRAALSTPEGEAAKDNSFIIEPGSVRELAAQQQLAVNGTDPLMPGAKKAVAVERSDAVKNTFFDTFARTTDEATLMARTEGALRKEAPETLDAEELRLLLTASLTRLKQCNSDSAFMSAAIDDAIQLTQDFLAKKPIFWSELGRHYQERIWRLFPTQTYSTDQASWETVELIEDELQSYHKNMKSKRFRRDLCGRDLNHPVCGEAFEGHQKKLALSPATLISAGLRAGLAEGID